MFQEVHLAQRPRGNEKKRYNNFGSSRRSEVVSMNAKAIEEARLKKASLKDKNPLEDLKESELPTYRHGLTTEEVAVHLVEPDGLVVRDRLPGDYKNGPRRKIDVNNLPSRQGMGSGEMRDPHKNPDPHRNYKGKQFSKFA
ncbi:MAG: hypothetical protein US42_C0007G0042 [Candidatus Magasanikbacteria bacterium GW2011_GWC2_37_14]|uniref:Uncharacterized protein n=1 Tax=Candidatus Magasanikbacteria bacterium GW2011_GWC2_37_14 TaxID=1619046 RepID=A0A0G0JHU0_9BACT|nr:MAG: hypothetical protein US42_C0007G0042 [Candidatus Magasanikbacteria bacterium GW2011_GWC2_37_14]